MVAPGQILGAAVAGFVAGGEAAPGAASTWGGFWSGAEEDSLGGSPAEELVQAMRSPRSKVGLLTLYCAIPPSSVLPCPTGSSSGSSSGCYASKLAAAVVHVLRLSLCFSMPCHAASLGIVGAAVHLFFLAGSGGCQVAAYLRLGLLQRAFETAAGANSRADMRLVAAEAGRRANADVVAMCTSYLSSHA